MIWKNKDIFIEITNMCNGGCITCLNKDSTRKKGVMPLEDFKKIIDEIELNEYKPRQVLLFGLGDTYMVENHKDYFDYAVNKLKGKVFLSITTNGSKVEYVPNVDHFDVSFNAGKKETYEKIHTGLKFDQVYENLKKLNKEGKLKNAHIHMLVNKLNKGEEKDVLKLFKDFDLEAIEFSYKYDNQCGKIEDQTLEEYKDDYKLPCHYACNVINIAWTGEVILCPHDANGEEVLGNIYENTLEEVWCDPRRQEIIYEHEQSNFEGICKDCNYNVTCSGKDQQFKKVGDKLVRSK